MQTTGKLTSAKAAGSGFSFGIDPVESTEANVKNMANVSYATFNGNPDDLHEGDEVDIIITKRAG